jgi:uncharacterized membrane protein YgdD (TMEM256/DUF423 family)
MKTVNSNTGAIPILLSAAALLTAAVALGAFGAHGLEPLLSAEMMQVYKTGVDYHFYHALGLFLVGILTLIKPSPLFRRSAVFLMVGIFLFSGSLYAMAISGITWLGAITPFGGVSFIAGWMMLFAGAWKMKKDIVH